jgi:hypothetical protein
VKNRKVIFGIVLVVLIGLWAAFRPERLFLDAKVNESLPSVGGSSAMADKPLATGSFHSVAHKGSGNAAILQLADGTRMLRFTNFETSNGPDVRVYLVAANDATDAETVKKAGFVEIAPLKGNIGDQNYQLPASLDLSKYHAVTIWCQRFSVNFATAPLTPASSTTAMNN